MVISSAKKKADFALENEGDRVGSAGQRGGVPKKPNFSDEAKTAKREKKKKNILHGARMCASLSSHR